MAYGSLLQERRRGLHKVIAEQLEAASASRPTMPFERLAHHYTEAGLIEQAVDHWRQAGQRAIERSANTEAVASLRKGLELLQELPDSPDVARQELSIQLGLGVAGAAVYWAGAPEVGQAYDRALTLSQQADEPADRFAAQWGLWRYCRTMGEFTKAQSIADELFRVGGPGG